MIDDYVVELVTSEAVALTMRVVKTLVFLLSAPHILANWRHSPVVIGGTGGSGTRGVLDILQKLSIYMAPAKGSRIFSKCFNGEPLDNSCMVPVGIYHHNSTPNYYNWLINGTCNDSDTSVAGKLRLEPWGQHYVDSVPDASRAALRWGWKIPTTMYHLDRICKMFPGLVFIQAVRNPLDMASTFYEHLPYRVKEFKSIHNGYANAASVLSERCATAKRSEAGSCALLAKELIVMGKCNENLKQRKHCDLTETSEGWRCLEMQLWAEMNYGGKFNFWRLIKFMEPNSIFHLLSTFILPSIHVRVEMFRTFA